MSAHQVATRVKNHLLLVFEAHTALLFQRDVIFGSANRRHRRGRLSIQHMNAAKIFSHSSHAVYATHIFSTINNVYGAFIKWREA